MARPLFTQLRIWIVGSLGALTLVVLFRTLRKKVVGCEHMATLIEHKGPVIFAFWHGRQLMMGELYRYVGAIGWPRICVLSSAHADGQSIAFAVKLRGVVSVTGSSSRGGMNAFRGLLRAVEQGLCPALTPDGPRGPIHQIKEGTIRLAQQTGLQILPISYSASRYKKFNSWDEMILPLPFSKIVFKVAPPLTIPAAATEAEVDEITKQLKETLDSLNLWCDENAAR